MNNDNHSDSNAAHVDPFNAFLGADPLASPSLGGGLAVLDASAGSVRGSYSKLISRQNPGCVLFVCDQSASMDEPFGASGLIKSRALADAVNNIIGEYLSRCERADGCRHYFDVGVIGYGGNEAGNALAGPLGSDILQPITRFASSTLRVEDRVKKLPDGAGGIIEQVVKFPVWVDARNAGATPMCTALRKAREVVAAWCQAHPESYPPTVIHITDGQSTDGDPEKVAEELKSLSTADGHVLLFNLHIAATTHHAIVFPSTGAQLADADAKRLFAMSSVVPPSLAKAVAARHPAATAESRFFGYNADFPTLVDFLQLGSAAAQQR